MSNIEKEVAKESKTETFYQRLSCPFGGGIYHLKYVVFLDSSELSGQILKELYKDKKAGEYLVIKDTKGRNIVISEIEGPLRG